MNSRTNSKYALGNAVNADMTILLVSENAVFLKRVRAVIRSEYVKTATIVTSSLRSSLLLSPKGGVQMLISDIRVSDGTNTKLLVRLQNQTGARVIVNLGSQPECVHLFLRKKVDGFFSEKSTMEEISHGIKKVFSGARFVSADIEQILLSHIIEYPFMDMLTKREKLVAHLLAADKSSKEISQLTGISTTTVGKYKKRIFEKLDEPNLVRLGIISDNKSDTIIANAVS